MTNPGKGSVQTDITYRPLGRLGQKPCPTCPDNKKPVLASTENWGREYWVVDSETSSIKEICTDKSAASTLVGDRICILRMEQMKAYSLGDGRIEERATRKGKQECALISIRDANLYAICGGQTISERYSIKSNRWQKVPSPEQNICANTLVEAVQSRYIYIIGEHNPMERLDCLDENAGWELLGMVPWSRNDSCCTSGGIIGFVSDTELMLCGYCGSMTFDMRDTTKSKTVRVSLPGCGQAFEKKCARGHGQVNFIINGGNNRDIKDINRQTVPLWRTCGFSAVLRVVERVSL